MSDVKRYDIDAQDENGEPCWDAIESHTGLYVLASDYEALRTQLATARSYILANEERTKLNGDIVTLEGQLATANERLREAEIWIRYFSTQSFTAKLLPDGTKQDCAEWLAKSAKEPT